jgi:PAS domain-containing protein
MITEPEVATRAAAADVDAAPHALKGLALPIARLAAHACAMPMAMVVLMQGDTPVFVAGSGLADTPAGAISALLKRLAPALETPARPPRPVAGSDDDSAAIHVIKVVQLCQANGTLLGLLAVMDTAPGALTAERERDLDALAGLLAPQLAQPALAGTTASDAARLPLQRSEEDAQRLATRLGITLDSITEGFYTLDHEWRFTFLNPHGEQLLGRSSADLLGKSFWREFPGAINTSFSEQIRAAVASSQHVEFESPYAPMDTWFEVRVYPFAEGVAVYFRDVGDKRKAREQLMLLETSISRLNDIVLITEAVPHGAPRVAAHAVRPAHAAPRGRTHLAGVSARRAGAGRTGHAQKRWPAFLDGSRHRAGG